MRQLLQSVHRFPGTCRVDSASHARSDNVSLSILMSLEVEHLELSRVWKRLGKCLS